MKKLLVCVIPIITMVAICYAQPAAKENVAGKDSLAKANEKATSDSIEKVFLSKLTYPYIKSSKWSV